MLVVKAPQIYHYNKYFDIFLNFYHDVQMFLSAFFYLFVQLQIRPEEGENRSLEVRKKRMSQNSLLRCPYSSICLLLILANILLATKENKCKIWYEVLFARLMHSQNWSCRFISRPHTMLESDRDCFMNYTFIKNYSIKHVAQLEK